MEELCVLAKVSESCPLSCIYCYEGDKSDAKMDENTLENMTRIITARDGARRTTFTWHGAEPLTAGLEFYKKARETQKKYSKNCKIRNGMQSNGVLLTPEIADYFAAEDIDIGFSLDGPQHIHDQTRVYHSGKGSFEDVMRAIKLMQDRGKKPGIIAVLTKKSLPFLDEIYAFFKSESLNFKINPVMKCGFAKDGKELHLTPEERAEAMCYLFDRWFYDNGTGPKADYCNMMSVAKAIFAKGGSSCDMLKNCQDSFISIGTDGTVFPCSRYSDKNVSYGNINQVKDFKEVLEHPLRQQLMKRYESLQECVQCQYNFLCYSGCMHNAYVAGDMMKKDPNCSSNKRVYEHISGRILEQLEKDGAIKKPVITENSEKPRLMHADYIKDGCEHHEVVEHKDYPRPESQHSEGSYDVPHIDSPGGAK